MTPSGPIVTQLHQWWRRGEYAPVICFYESKKIPIRAMVTAAALCGDFIVLEPGVALIGNGEERTLQPAARQVAAWLEADGWRCGSSASCPTTCTWTCSCACWASGWRAYASTPSRRRSSTGWSEGRRDRAGLAGRRLRPRRQRRLPGRRPRPVDGRLGDVERALARLGITVLDPDLSSFTLGGGARIA